MSAPPPVPRPSDSLLYNQSSIAMYRGYVRPPHERPGDPVRPQSATAYNSLVHDINSQHRQHNTSLSPVGKQYGQVESSNSLLQRSGANTSTMQPPQKPVTIPLPNRPGLLALSRESTGPTANKDGGHARSWPHAPEPPLIAPRFLNKSQSLTEDLILDAQILIRSTEKADFSPWNGNHAEDKLTLDFIKHGFLDKQIVPAEHQMARPTIWPVLKKGKGVQMLSVLYAATLEEREAQGRITARTTFKPPPRVTLTDAKREAWLKDLSNAKVPLRRLSRTIPHGIRGKSLLEQCSSKKIAVDRAVWLAKCVGANEIRAFRRKGAGATLSVGGETRWIRDWTNQVEQWIESVVSNCGEPLWSENMNYSLQLGSHIYSEGLVDRDHFLDWIVRIFGTCSLDTVPVWLLIVQLFRGDLVSNRKTGSQLAASALRKLNEISASPDPSMYALVVSRLRQMVEEDLGQHRDNFVSLNTWQNFGPILKLIGEANPSELSTAMDDVVQRCKRLLPTSKRENKAEETLVRILDLNFIHCAPSSTWDRCQNLSGGKDLFVHTAVSWVASRFREGPLKVLLGARLLRRAKKLGLDIEGPILQILGTRNTSNFDNAAIFHLMSDLVRSKTFSPSKYLQWLIAGGILHGHHDIANIHIPAIRLLIEMPVLGLSDKVINLRRMLLENMQYSTSKEEAELHSLISIVEMNISVDTPESDSESNKIKILECLDAVSASSWTTKSEIGRWVRSWLLSRVRLTKSDTIDDDDGRSDSDLDSCNFFQYQILATVLESTKDFGILADILKISSASSNPQILASIADNLNDKSEEFHAMGAFDDCLDRLIDRYQTLKNKHSANEAVATSLLDLCSPLRGYEDIVKDLEVDLAQCRRATAAAACSPVSEHMMELNQSDESNFSEEAERALASGNTVDSPTLNKLFGAITARVEDFFDAPYSKICHFGQLLAKLRQLETTYYDELMRAWLSRIYFMEKRPPLASILPPLCGSRCVNLEMILESFSAENCQSERAEKTERQNLAFEILEIFLTSTEVNLGIFNAFPLTFEQSRAVYRSQRNKALRSQPRRFLDLIAAAISAVAKQDPTKAATAMNSIVSDPIVLSYMRTLVIHDTENFAKVMMKPHHAVSKQEADLAHGLTFSIYNTGPSHAHRLDSIVRGADMFSYPFARIQVAMLFSKGNINAHLDQESSISQLCETVDLFHSKDTRILTDLVISLGPKISAKVFEHATMRFQGLFPAAKPISANHSTFALTLDSANIFLNIISSLAAFATDTQARKQMTVITERVSVLGRLLEDIQKARGSNLVDLTPANLSEGQQSLQETFSWLSIILRLAADWRHHFPNVQKHPKEQMLLITSLANILLMPVMRHDQNGLLMFRMKHGHIVREYYETKYMTKASDTFLASSPIKSRA
ncbi:MAG: RNA polymerase II mediator complex subunit [Vezdaea aestivalis]|nr:MAG: RNA polymerase II mediator complex subunit [Vezdaea aestivalis]